MSYLGALRVPRFPRVPQVPRVPQAPNSPVTRLFFPEFPLLPRSPYFPGSPFPFPFTQLTTQSSSGRRVPGLSYPAACFDFRKGKAYPAVLILPGCPSSSVPRFPRLPGCFSRPIFTSPSLPGCFLQRHSAVNSPTKSQSDLLSYQTCPTRLLKLQNRRVSQKLSLPGC